MLPLWNLFINCPDSDIQKSATSTVMPPKTADFNWSSFNPDWETSLIHFVMKIVGERRLLQFPGDESFFVEHFDSSVFMISPHLSGNE